MHPLGFHTLSLQPTKILPFLVVNTGSVLIGFPLKKFLPTPLVRPTKMLTLFCLKLQ